MKLDFVSAALITLLGPEQVEKALEIMASGWGPLDTEETWRILAGDRSEELSWFKEQILLGHGLAKPYLKEVEYEETAGEWQVRVTIVNEGDAYAPVPLWISAPGGRKAVKVPVEAGEVRTATFALPEPPDQILLDPDCEILRQRLRGGDACLRWTRKGGIQ